MDEQLLEPWGEYYGDMDDVCEKDAIDAMEIKPGCTFINLSNPIKGSGVVSKTDLFICNFCCKNIKTKSKYEYIEWADKKRDVYCNGCYAKMIKQITDSMTK